MICKRCGTRLKSRYSAKAKRIAKEFGKVGIPLSSKIYWCPKCYPDK